jgi:Ala-tRNA(Pro) deacylase
MAIAHTLEDYMTSKGIHYEVVPHPRTLSSLETAEAAHIPGDALAKAVLLEDDDGYLMAVVPATHHIKLGRLSERLNRKLRLAVESELTPLFKDCQTGAFPPLGMAYGMPTIVDDSLIEQPDIYFEAGDHEGLIHLSGGCFQSLLAGARLGRFSQRM